MSSGGVNGDPSSSPPPSFVSSAAGPAPSSSRCAATFALRSAAFDLAARFEATLAASALYARMCPRVIVGVIFADSRGDPGATSFAASALSKVALSFHLSLTARTASANLCSVTTVFRSLAQPALALAGPVPDPEEEDAGARGLLVGDVGGVTSSLTSPLTTLSSICSSERFSSPSGIVERVVISFISAAPPCWK